MTANVDKDKLVMVENTLSVFAASGGLNLRIPAVVIEALGIEAKQKVKWYRDSETNDVVLRFSTTE